MKHLALGLLIAGSCSLAHAGFITGFAVGTMMKGSDKKPATPQLVASDTHDVIMCEKAFNKGEVCEDSLRDADNRFIRHMTPSEYAAHAGYQFVHRKAVLLTEKRTYIVMEVSKMSPNFGKPLAAN
jgi:hypothetical protein